MSNYIAPHIWEKIKSWRKKVYYPNYSKIKEANDEQIIFWWRFLRPPKTKNEMFIISEICKRFNTIKIKNI